MKLIGLFDFDGVLNPGAGPVDGGDWPVCRATNLSRKIPTRFPPISMVRETAEVSSSGGTIGGLGGRQVRALPPYFS